MWERVGRRGREEDGEERKRKGGERELSTSNFHTCAETSRTYTKEKKKK